MTEIQQAAYIIAMASCAQIEATAMMTHNSIFKDPNHPNKYTYNDFMDLITKYGIHHNQVIESFR